jgi:hypothetical protein
MSVAPVANGGHADGVKFNGANERKLKICCVGAGAIVRRVRGSRSIGVLLVRLRGHSDYGW